MKRLILFLLSSVLILTSFVAEAQKPIKRQTKPKKEQMSGQKPRKTSNTTSSNSSTSLRESENTTQPEKLSLGYGIWEGGIKNNKPDGKGKITFNTLHRVDRSSSYEANPGDYFIATYDNGNLISGKLYDSDGNLLKTIIP